MAYFLLEYHFVDDYLDRRGPLREEHLALLRSAHERGDVVLAGALAEPVDRGVLVWRTDDPGPVGDFVRDDPYVTNGLVTSWTVRPGPWSSARAPHR